MIEIFSKIISGIASLIVSTLIVVGVVPTPEVLVKDMPHEETKETEITHPEDSPLETETALENESENSLGAKHSETENALPPPPKEEEVIDDKSIVEKPTPAEIIPEKVIEEKNENEEVLTESETPVLSDTLPTFETLDPQDVNTKVRGALVNIFCRSSGESLTNSIVGSGILIDSRGVILTNAHVAQFFLLKDTPSVNALDCMVRMGDPATPLYRAELLYISPSWVTENASLITSDRPTGTGQFDFAFLYITGRTDPSLPLPDAFPFIKPNTHRELSIGEQVLVAGYPAGFLGSIEIEKSLYSASSFVTVEELYTYATTSIDLVALSGSVVSQRGSSGGAVVSIARQEVEGVVTTVVSAEQTKDRTLRAITLSHIDDTLFKESSLSINSLLGSNLPQTAEAFEEQIASELRSLLLEQFSLTE
ncbi:MAG: serine protease [Candidatus Paceibacterota bacterium]